MKDHKVKVGRMLLVSHGAYSSYERHGWFVAVQEFSPEEKLRQFLEEDKGQNDTYHFEYTKFLSWLTRQAVLVEVEEFFDEWHLGDYGDAAESAFMPRSARETEGEQP
jgi:hypothetical protein